MSSSVHVPGPKRRGCQSATEPSPRSTVWRTATLEEADPDSPPNNFTLANIRANKAPFFFSPGQEQGQHENLAASSCKRGRGSDVPPLHSFIEACSQLLGTSCRSLSSLGLYQDFLEMSLAVCAERGLFPLPLSLRVPKVEMGINIYIDVAQAPLVLTFQLVAVGDYLGMSSRPDFGDSSSSIVSRKSRSAKSTPRG
ncbi:uncharacterized protein BJX67DRAFT_342607 [Aspergillus lucknowensis]|uniref:Uncharacterized protein n=1 Tax=Aspergillus lucknowensis TaxID=176173 RepID=A0ABR4M4P0_9EURO